MEKKEKSTNCLEDAKGCVLAMEKQKRASKLTSCLDCTMRVIAIECAFRGLTVIRESQCQNKLGSALQWQGIPQPLSKDNHAFLAQDDGLHTRCPVHLQNSDAGDNVLVTDTEDTKYGHSGSVLVPIPNRDLGRYHVVQNVLCVGCLCYRNVILDEQVVR